jgi:hypothetical protein
MIMRRSGSSWCAVALAAALILPWSGARAFAAADGSLPDDSSGAPAGYQGVRPARPAVPEGLDDMLKPLDEAAPATVARSDLSDVALAPLLETVTRLALWERLAKLAPSQRPDALVEVELGNRSGPADRLAAAQVGQLWGEGRYEEAITALRSFEESGGRCALGIGWKPGTEPAALAGPLATAGGGVDVRIGARTGGRMVSLDYHRATGYLFAVVGWGVATGGEAHWTMNRSTNDGASWAETYAWYAGVTGGLIDMGAAVVGGYVYVGYVPGDVQNEYRLRRCIASSGASDGTYGFHTIFSSGADTFEEVVVASNAQTYDNRIYCFAIQSDDSLRFAWDAATDGTTFTEDSPGYGNAESALDVSWNHDHAGRFLFASYVGTDGSVRLAHYDGYTWGNRGVASASAVIHRTGVSVSAYADVVICAYEYAYTGGRGIRYSISYDAGDTWNIGDLAQPDGAPVTSYMCPDVDARDGNGTAIVYGAEQGEPDAAYYDLRPGYQPGPWLGALQFNDNDLTTGSRMTLSPVPALAPSCFSHGAVYFFGGVPYFDMPGLGGVDVPPPVAAAGVRLDPPAPSPFSDRAAVRFTLPTAGPARLEVFNVQGRRVATLADGPMEAGTHSLALDGRGLGSGVYFCRLTAGAARQTSRFVVVH